jgi:hypothetical protein
VIESVHMNIQTMFPHCIQLYNDIPCKDYVLIREFIEAYFILVFINNLRSGIHRHKFIKNVISIVEEEELPDQWKESIIVPVYKKGDKTDCSNCCYQLHTKFYPVSVSEG